MGMVSDRDHGRDLVGRAAAAVILLLLAGIIVAQIALASPYWRADHCPVDVLEGVRLEDAW